MSSLAENDVRVNASTLMDERVRISPDTIEDLAASATTDELLSALRGVDGDGNFWSCVANTFDLMDIAEVEIARKKALHPDRRKEIDRVFSVACPPPGMSAYSSKIYRAHVREICDLFARGEPFVHPTDAEILIYFSEFSQKTPIDGVGSCLFARLFRICFPDANIWDEEMEAAHQSQERLYGKQADTLYSRIKERVRS